MRSIKTKRLLLVGASVFGIAAIITGTLFVRSQASHAASGPSHFLAAGALSSMSPKFGSLGPKGPEAGRAHSRNSTCVAGLDSVTNFCGQYTVAGFDSNGNPNDTWLYNMVGNAPQQSGPGYTLLNAPIIPVKVNFLNTDGSVAAKSNPLGDVLPTLGSPVFSPTKFSSSAAPTQLSDAVLRAEFYNQAKQSWHNVLIPELKRSRTMSIPATDSSGNPLWYGIQNDDGSCCAAYLVDANTFGNLLFPPTYPVTNDTVIGAAELAGDMTPHDITTLLFDNVYLFIGPNPPGNGNCCILGYHTFDFEPGATSTSDPRAYVMNYSSWISPGLFGGGFQDVTATSHEMNEIYNDPFVTAFNNLDVTPWWLSGGNCQNDLENGDVVEGLSNPTFPITMHGTTYHPQTVALLQWFESTGHSDALHGAYSYPDESVLTTSNVSQPFNCAPQQISD
jgi:hypothetical protein